MPIINEAGNPLVVLGTGDVGIAPVVDTATGLVMLVISQLDRPHELGRIPDGDPIEFLQKGARNGPLITLASTSKEGFEGLVRIIQSEVIDVWGATEPPPGRKWSPLPIEGGE